MDDDLLKSYPETPKIKLWRYQWICFPLLILVPLLALLGFFGKKLEMISFKKEGLETNIEYPKKFRQGQYETIRITFFNSTARVIEDITLQMDNDYIKNFDNISFTPNHVDANLEINIGSIPPEEKRYITLLLKTAQFGHHKGVFRIKSQEEEVLSYEIKTLILP